MSNKQQFRVGQMFTLESYDNGHKTRARIIDIRGKLFKKYDCAVWGVDSSGTHIWPNGSVSSYINTLTSTELARGKEEQL